MFQIAASLVLLWTGSFEWILVYASVGLSLFSILAMSSIFVLRIRRPDMPRPFRTPFYPFTPILYLAQTIALMVAAFVSKPDVSTISLVSMLAGIPVYYACGAHKRARPA
jgi:APA family basic amino acid/polyamine antiporter